DVDTGTLTIKGNIAESPCKFEAGGDSVSINMPTVPTTVFEGKAKYSTYDDAVGVTSSMLKISCPKEVAGVKLSLITNDKITGNDK
ncbi:TPA: type 1 fimbrial protein, partial [Escherichia coli]